MFPYILLGLAYGLGAFTDTTEPAHPEYFRNRFMHAITFFNSKPIWKQKQHIEAVKNIIPVLDIKQ